MSDGPQDLNSDGHSDPDWVWVPASDAKTYDGISAQGPIDELGELTPEMLAYLASWPTGMRDRIISIETHGTIGSDWIRERWGRADAARVSGDWSDYANPSDFDVPAGGARNFLREAEAFQAAALTNAAAVEEAALSGADRRRWSPTRWRKHDRGTHPTRLCYPRVRRPKLDRIAWQCVAVYAALGLVFIWTLWLCRPR